MKETIEDIHPAPMHTLAPIRCGAGSKINSLCSPDNVLYDSTGIVRELKRKEIKKK
jgi:hypothetical protein